MAINIIRDEALTESALLQVIDKKDDIGAISGLKAKLDVAGRTGEEFIDKVVDLSGINANKKIQIAQVDNTIISGSYKFQYAGKAPNIHDVALTKEVLIINEDWEKYFLCSGYVVTSFETYPNSINLRKFSTAETSIASTQTNIIDSKAYRCSGVSISFITDAPKVEFLSKSNVDCAIYIDDVLITDSTSTVIADTYPNLCCTKINKGTRVFRKYTFVYGYTISGFYGVAVSPLDTVYAPIKKGSKVMLVGDSLSCNTGSYSTGLDSGFHSYFQLLANNIDTNQYLVNGIGGTGIDSSSTDFNYIQRKNDISVYNPDVLFIQVSPNDVVSTQIQKDNLYNKWIDYLTYCISVMNGKQIFIIGYPSSTSNASAIVKEDIAHNAYVFMSLTHKNLKFIKMSTSDLPKIQAYNDSIMLSEGVHLTTLGYKTVADSITEYFLGL